MATGPKLRSVNSMIGAEALCEMSFKPSKPGRTRGADGGQSSRSVKQKVETHGEARGVAGLARGGTVDLNQFDHASLREHGQLGAAREQLEAQLASGRLGKGNAETRHQPDDDGEERPLPWGAVPTLLSTDTYGVPIFSPSQMPVVQLQVKLRAPLLYWSEKNRWLWHKKWTLPKIDVRVTFAPPGTQQQWSGPPVSVILSATTMPHSQEPTRRGSSSNDGGEAVTDQGLVGECQQQLTADGHASFSSIFFKRTSFHCANLPFHLACTVVAPAHHPLAMLARLQGASAPLGGAAGLVANQIQGLGLEPYGMVALGSACSAAITVDARKRTTSERPGANANDARLMTRRRGSAPQPGGSPAQAGGAKAGGCPIGERYALPEASAAAVAHSTPGDGGLLYHATAMAPPGMQLAHSEHFPFPHALAGGFGLH